MTNYTTIIVLQIVYEYDSLHHMIHGSDSAKCFGSVVGVFVSSSKWFTSKLFIWCMQSGDNSMANDLGRMKLEKNLGTCFIMQ